MIPPLRQFLHKFPRFNAFLLGAIGVAGYAPLQLYPLAILTLAALFSLWRQAASGRRAFVLGFCYGLGLYGAGVYWIYISLHDFGGMPLPLAALATATLCSFLALFPAAAGWLASRFGARRAYAMPAAWVLTEWILNWIFTGFPWLTLGYSQVPYSPLAGIAPVLGVFGVSLAAACGAALLAAWLDGAARRPVLLSLLALLLVSSALKQIEWVRPLGAPIRVSLLQGNIPQDLKWRPEAVEGTLRTYLELARQYPAPLTVLPETALPMLLEQIPVDYLEALSLPARQAGGDLLLGVAEWHNDHYYNSLVSLGNAPRQSYRKSHLVPFGEFIPFKSAIGWIYKDLLHIPLADLSPGEISQRPLQIAGQKVAVNICYEDVFGEEIIRQLPQATLLVNASNDGWYGRSSAAHQHLQISQTRALESGRMMLRATNTGATAIISARGEVIAEAPHFTTTALTGLAQGYTGTTPYVLLGNWPVLMLILLWGFALCGLPRKSKKSANSRWETPLS